MVTPAIRRASIPAAEESLEKWLPQEERRAEELLLRNISPPGSIRGAIVASPSRSRPNYYFHWVRDAAIAIKAVLCLYKSTTSPAARQRYFDLLMDFVDFSRRIQGTASHASAWLGEPKFTVTGEPFSGPWARPQPDGNAIRAIELTHWAFTLLDEGRLQLVREKLYRPSLPADSVIKADLEYISHHWSKPCFDLWEEVWGHHFWTRLLERRALINGAALATRLGDAGAARWYLEQAAAMDDALRLHWDPVRNHLVASLAQGDGPLHWSGLDSSAVLATTSGYTLGDELSPAELYGSDHEQVLATAAALESTFEAIYPINDPARRIPGIAMGRYPEDRYDGYERRADLRGNPWSTITIGFASYYYKLVDRYRKLQRIAFTPTNLPFFQRLPVSDGRFRANEWIEPGDPFFGELLDALRRKGDSFLERVRYHLNPDGSMSEQINRWTGFQQGAQDLSMNYAAYILAVGMRRHLLRSPGR